MASSNLSWQKAIFQVLEDAGEPLHYQEITNRIGQQSLYDFSNSATPAATVRSNLSRMVKPGDSIHDDRIRRIAPGIYYLGEFSLDDDDQEADEGQTDVERSALVPAYGLFWDKDYVSWKSGKILGRQIADAESVNFADQQGVYLLHRDNSVVYIGKTTDNLYGRLRYHNRQKNLRWNKFSWFGLREVSDNAELGELPLNFTVSDLITILESVLIEALEPPINGRRGDRMGEIYEQVVDPQVAKDRAISLLRAAVG